jgi:hypothetical protein
LVIFFFASVATKMATTTSYRRFLIFVSIAMMKATVVIAIAIFFLDPL